MDVTIKEMPELRVGTLRHIGPYEGIPEAFQRLDAIAGPAGLASNPDATLLAVYHDDPATTPSEALRSDAGRVVPSATPLPKGLVELRLAAGRYARTTHVGPYPDLPGAWTRLLDEWLPGSGQRAGRGPRYEIYRNTPAQVSPQQLRTELYLLLE